MYLYFLECPIGYHLKDCLEKCNTPTYGEECQFICDCPYYDCHFAHGCLQEVESFTHKRPKSMMLLDVLFNQKLNLSNEIKNKILIISR